MSFTKPIVNAINNALKPHENTVKQIQALFLWNRPIFSIIFFVVVEGLFALAFFLPFSWSCNLCLIIGSFVLVYCLYGAFPSIFDRILTFEIKEVKEGASNRIRDTPEIAAFLTTAISFWSKLFESTFHSAVSTSVYDAIFSTLMLLALFLLTYFVGDFWIIWLIFHCIFVVPPILVLPTVRNWLTESKNETDAFHGASTAQNSSATSTINSAVENSSDGNEEPQTMGSESFPPTDSSVLDKNSTF